MAPSNADIEARKAAVDKAKAALDAAEAAVAKENEHIAAVNAAMEAEGEEPFTSGGEIGPLQDAAKEARYKLWAAERALKEAQQPPVVEAAVATEGSTLDTGHYDDGHSLGWKKSEQPNWTNLSANINVDDQIAEAERNLQLEHDERMEEVPVSPTSFDWKFLAGGIFAVLAIGLIAVVALTRDSGTSKANQPAAASSVDDDAADDSGGVTPITSAAGPVRYQSNCQGACFMTVDNATCDRTFTFDLTLLGDDVGKFEGKTAVISTRGPGLQPTYEVPVAKGKVALTVVATGASYGGDPVRACGAPNTTLGWTGLLTSVDGQPTITPEPPR